MRDLARGELATYAEIAEEIGHPGAGQAVANVLRGASELPWWRVVPADGRLYRSHVRVQGPLLEAEGHTVDEHRRVRASPDSQDVAAPTSSVGSTGQSEPR